MNFRTALTLKQSPHRIHLHDPILTLGSCFAQSIGHRFNDNKFKAQVNPFGTSYHPLSISKLLHYSTYHEYPAPHTYVENDGVFFNYDFYSGFHGDNQANVQKQLQECIGVIHYFLKNCKVLMITWGTAWLFERRDTGESVANCHKMPSALFTRRLATQDEMVISFETVLRALLSMNPGVQVILTVSPVRHTSDTLPLNNLSKSALRLICHELAERHPNVEYFPAYEIMMDDLRDYRYYTTDMIHPSEAAEDYIWEKFSDCYFDSATLQFLKEWADIRKALAHRPFHPKSQAHEKFMIKTLARLEEMKAFVDVEQEISQIKALKEND